MSDSPRKSWWVLAALLLAASPAVFGEGSGTGSFAGFYGQTAARQADGKLLVAGGATNRAGGFDFAVVRLDADNTVDASFGSMGIARVPVYGDFEWAFFIAVDGEGKLAIGGTAQDPATCACPLAQCQYGPCHSSPALARLNADGTADRSFNHGAPLVLALDYAGAGYVTSDDVDFQGFEMEADGSIVLLASTLLDDDTLTPASAVARVDRDGTLDRSFAADTVAAHVVQLALVIEYYNPGLDHYFMTASRSEFAALDEGTFGDWRRTHGAFHAWPAGSVMGQPVCRLYGAASAGLNSHLYFVDADDCRDRAASDAWMLESPEVFRVDPLPRAGDCSAADVPVYRLSNERRDANDRFTTDPRIAQEMVAKGFAPAGSGPRGVYMCVPA